MTRRKSRISTVEEADTADLGWVLLQGYEGSYEIHPAGRVRSITRFIHYRDGSYRLHQGKSLKLYLGDDGYPRVRLRDEPNEKSVCPTIHRLLAKHFIPNPENKAEVNHIDGNKKNYSVTNLEWVTRLENMQHARQTCLTTTAHLIRHKGEANHAAKVTAATVMDMRRLRHQTGLPFEVIGQSFGLSKAAAMSAIKGKTWAHLPHWREE
jgi:hypothetical protein